MFQLGLGYYCIEHVEWLGWDLVEPLTYTIGQGTFIWGMLYMLVHRRLHGANYSDLKEDYVDRRIQQILKQQGDFSVMEKEMETFLRYQLAETEKSIQRLEDQRIY